MVPDYCEDAGGSLSRRSKKWHVFGAIRSDELGRGMLRTGRYHDKQIRLSGKLFESRRSPPNHNSAPLSLLGNSFRGSVAPAETHFR